MRLVLLLVFLVGCSASRVTTYAGTTTDTDCYPFCHIWRDGDAWKVRMAGRASGWFNFFGSRPFVDVPLPRDFSSESTYALEDLGRSIRAGKWGWFGAFGDHRYTRGRVVVNSWDVERQLVSGTFVALSGQLGIKGRFVAHFTNAG